MTRTLLISIALVILQRVVSAQTPNDYFFPDLKYDSITVSQYVEGLWQPDQSVVPAWTILRLDTIRVDFQKVKREDRVNYSYSTDSVLSRGITWSTINGVSSVAQIDSFWYDKQDRVSRVDSWDVGLAFKTRTEFVYDVNRLDSASIWWKDDTGWVFREGRTYLYGSRGELSECRSTRNVKRYYYDNRGALQVIIQSSILGNTETPTIMWEYHNARQVARLSIETSIAEPLTCFVGDTGRAVLFVTNRSKGSIHLTSITMANPEFRLELPSLPILLQEDSTILLPLVFCPQERGLVATSVSFRDDEGQVIEMPLTASAVAAHLSVLADTVHFADVPVGELATQAVVLINDGDGDIDIDSICISAPKFTLYGFEPQRIQQKGALGLTVDYLSDVSAFDSATLAIYSRGIQGSHKTLISLIASSGKSSAVQEARARAALHIYPNPCGDRVRINAGEPITYSVFSATGECLLSGAAGASNQQILVERLSPGEYLMRIVQESGVTAYEKFVRKR